MLQLHTTHSPLHGMVPQSTAAIPSLPCRLCDVSNCDILSNLNHHLLTSTLLAFAISTLELSDILTVSPQPTQTCCIVLFT